MVSTVPPPQVIALDNASQRDVLGERNLALQLDIPLHSLEEGIPSSAIRSPIPPIPVDSRSWTLTLAEDEELATRAPTNRLWSLSEKEVSLESRLIRLDPVDPILVRSPTVRLGAIRIHPLNGCRGSWVAVIPNAGNFRVLLQQELANVPKRLGGH